MTTAKPVDEEAIRKVAQVARLELTEEEASRLSGDLSEVIEAFRVLQEIPTKDVKPTFQPIETTNVTREDEVEPSVPRNKLLRGLRNKEDGYVKGPRVV
jgi:aspartyl-tRNA(Asn)/glutamyl-tRNA(Gln) amidotransferase subunit C